ncbi:MAG: hypothetical protein RLY17_782 [Pseudomonadota bacterium]
MSDGDLQQFQAYLLNNPQSEGKINKTGGYQKIRLAGLSRRKCGDLKVIYHIVTPRLLK